jgi:hypothetical protein
MQHDQKSTTQKIEIAGIWAASIVLLAFFIAAQIIKARG